MDFSGKIKLMLLVLSKWLPAYISKMLYRPQRPIHVLFCMVDHYEPGTGGVDAETEQKRVDFLLSVFPRLADRHRDSSGNCAKRTWFFPPHYHRHNTLKKLVMLCEGGYGEIELHLHHGKIRPDTSENLEATLIECIRAYSDFGIFGTLNGRKAYGFIHGDWALDNSRNGRYCGVNDEITILKRTGCYADFTFPSVQESNPFQINSIYYARDNPDRPKSYNTGVPVLCGGGNNSRDLMIIQGPIFPFFQGNKVLGLRYFGDVVNGTPPVTAKRIDAWVETGIHVIGKREWVIVKTHTHGATDSDAVLGKEIDFIYTYLEQKYGDGKKYVLHYVTARELYNIIKALEAGEQGTDPELFRDYLIKPPIYDSSPEISEAPTVLRALVAKTYSG